MCSCLYLHTHDGLKSDNGFKQVLTQYDTAVNESHCEAAAFSLTCEHGNVEVMMRVVILLDDAIMFMASRWEPVTDQ